MRTGLHDERELVAMLLQAGADVHATNDYGQTPIRGATRAAEVLLVEAGAEPPRSVPDY